MKKHAIAFVLVTIFLDTVGFGIIVPVMPRLIVELTGEPVGHAAAYGGWLLALYAALQFFCAPLMGNLSDRFGRRPVLLASLSAFGVDYLFMGSAPTLAWLFVGRAIAGICGASYTIGAAYIADVTTPETRARGFGLVGAAWGVGFVLGPVIGGLLGEVNTRLPFFAAAALALLNVLYGFFVLPESLRAENRRAFSLKRANPFGAILQIRRYPLVLGLLGAMLFYAIAHDANPSTWAYYTTEKFGWSTAEVGYSTGVVGLSMAIVQGMLVGPVVARLGERRAAYLGFTLYAVSFFGFALASSGWMLYAFIVPLALGSVTGPSLRSLMSRQVPPDSQGELQGAVTSLQSLTAVFAPLLMTQLFRHFASGGPSVPYFPGAPFFAAGLLTLASLTLCALVIRQAGKRGETAPPAAGEAGSPPPSATAS